MKILTKSRLAGTAAAALAALSCCGCAWYAEIEAERAAMPNAEQMNRNWDKENAAIAARLRTKTFPCGFDEAFRAALRGIADTRFAIAAAEKSIGFISAGSAGTPLGDPAEKDRFRDAINAKYGQFKSEPYRDSENPGLLGYFRENQGDVCIRRERALCVFVSEAKPGVCLIELLLTVVPPDAKSDALGKFPAVGEMYPPLYEREYEMLWRAIEARLPAEARKN